MKKRLLLALLLSFPLMSAQAKVVTQTVDYKDGDTVLEGYLAYDDSLQGKRPGILVVHEWNGLGTYVQGRAQQLAQLGYVAFAADIYGKGVRPNNRQACQVQAGKYHNDRPLLRQRAQAGFEMLQKNEKVDPAKIAAIGYCFGGTAVLELARSGAPVAGVVSFHGGLDSPTPQDAKNIKGKILICQGGADKGTLAQLPGLKRELDDAKVDYRVIIYPGAMHGFTNPDNKGEVPGVKYNPPADKASWKAMQEFLDKLFKP